MKNVGYYNGEIGLIEEMRVPMNDRALYFGDGVYEATAGANRVIYELKEHLDRFFNSYKAIRLPFKMSREELTAELQKCVNLMDSDGEIQIYWQFSRGTAMRNHLFPADEKGNLMITVREVPVASIAVPKKSILVEDTRFLHCNIKTLNLLPSVMASQKAKDAGCNEAIFHRGERVTECAHSNVHILKDGVLHTAQTDNLILPGIARMRLLKLCKKMGISCVEQAFTVDELFAADEIIVTSASVFGISVGELEGKKVGGKAPELLHKLQQAMVDDFLAATGHKLEIMG